MLEQQQRIRDPVGLPSRLDPLLDAAGLLVGNQAQAHDQHLVHSPIVNTRQAPAAPS